jgi:hypothetical protein
MSECLIKHDLYSFYPTDVNEFFHSQEPICTFTQHQCASIKNTMNGIGMQLAQMQTEIKWIGHDHEHKYADFLELKCKLKSNGGLTCVS